MYLFKQLYIDVRFLTVRKIDLYTQTLSNNAPEQLTLHLPSSENLPFSTFLQ